VSTWDDPRSSPAPEARHRENIYAFPVKALLAAALFVALAASPAIAKQSCLSCPAVPAPGPIAGADLGYLVPASGYYAVRR